ncbi:MULTISPECIES: hypothetical protein, partial [unclassified Paraburkholderia]|uniref:hypothetical protein n=1 Tax=unclassified Paraburkholderia TaxID=2615204 RepID=UPI001C856C9A
MMVLRPVVQARCALPIAVVRRGFLAGCTTPDQGESVSLTDIQIGGAACLYYQVSDMIGTAPLPLQHGARTLDLQENCLLQKFQRLQFVQSTRPCLTCQRLDQCFGDWRDAVKIVQACRGSGLRRRISLRRRCDSPRVTMVVAWIKLESGGDKERTSWRVTEIHSR